MTDTGNQYHTLYSADRGATWNILPAFNLHSAQGPIRNDTTVSYQPILSPDGAVLASVEIAVNGGNAYEMLAIRRGGATSTWWLNAPGRGADPASVARMSQGAIICYGYGTLGANPSSDANSVFAYLPLP
ncbi:MAG: hypothetical protein ABI068_12965 [Ktedonobacterales bacterium]